MMFKRILIIASALGLLTGCSASQGQGSTEDQNLPISEVSQKKNVDSQDLSGKQIAKRLVHIANRLPGVNDATAIVAGNYAVVGIDVDKNLDRTEVGNIKNTVTEALVKDPYGAKAVVTSDPDIVQRLKNMGASIQKGKPVSGIANELALIVERLMPDVPNRTLPNDPENNPDTPKLDQAKDQAQ